MSALLIARPLRILIVLAAGMLMLAACGGGDDDSKSAENRNNFGNVTPENRADVPPRVEEVSIKIQDGKIDTETLTLQQDEPSVLHVENADNQAYKIEITPNLVTPTDIAASTATDVKFTTPNADRYELKLLPASGTGDPLDTLQVIVQAPGAVNNTSNNP
jgi:hypothetical protein